jgi:diguanylate cyclase (GGDEF)-like protein
VSVQSSRLRCQHTGLIVLTSAVAVAFGGLSLVQQRRLHEARHDPVTGLPTRDLWTLRAEQAVRRPAGLVVLLVDGDKLKQVNDGPGGHDAGDAVISALGERLAAWVGSRGLVGHFGGDEFAVFLRPGPRDLQGGLDRLGEILSAPVAYGEAHIPTSASIGVALVCDLVLPTVPQALKAADLAMYEVKDAGGAAWAIAERRTEPYVVSDSPRRRSRTHGSAV